MLGIACPPKEDFCGRERRERRRDEAGGKHRSVQCERGDRAHLLEELEQVELVPMLGQQVVAYAPDIDRVLLDLSATGRYTEERTGVPSAIRVAANDGRPGVDDVVDLDSEVVEGGEVGSEDRDRSGLSWICVAVVVDVVGMQQRGVRVEVVSREGLGEALGELVSSRHVDSLLLMVVMRRLVTGRCDPRHGLRLAVMPARGSEVGAAPCGLLGRGSETRPRGPAPKCRRERLRRSRGVG